MARQLFGVEKGVRLFNENGAAGVDALFGSAQPGGDSGDQDAAPVGSLYARTDGSFYQKIASTNATSDWLRMATLNDVYQLSWRSERVRAATGDAAPVSGSTIDLSSAPFSDDDTPQLAGADFMVDDYVIFGVGGTPKLMRVSVVAGDVITVVDAADPLADNDSFIVRNYLPDSPGAQESYAIVVYNGAAIIKLADFNWAIATGINLSGSYVGTTNGTPAAGDTVEQAIGKLDANQRDLTTLSGEAQGAVDHGTFTGDIIPDNSTTHAALQALETQLVTTRDETNDLITLSGVAANATDLGTFPGTTIPDNSTVKGALTALESAIENGVTYTANGVTTATVLDQLLVDVYCAVKWNVYIREAANPSRVVAMEVFSTHNGTPSADATQIDDTVFSKLKIGTTFNADVAVVLSGSGASQYMQLKVTSSTAGVDVRVTREAVKF